MNNDELQRVIPLVILHESLKLPIDSSGGSKNRKEDFANGCTIFIDYIKIMSTYQFTIVQQIQPITRLHGFFVSNGYFSGEVSPGNSCVSFPYISAYRSAAPEELFRENIFFFLIGKLFVKRYHA